MKTLLSFLNYVLFGNIYIAICAVMLCMHTNISFNLELDPFLLVFIFFSTISSYDLHSIYHAQPISESKRIDWIRSNKKALIYSFVISIIAALFTLLWIIEIWYWAIPIAILTFLYSLPRIFPKSGKPLKFIQLYKAFYLAFVWTLVTVFLPYYQGKAGINMQLLIFFITRYLFILQVCLLFDYRDKYLLLPKNRLSILKFINDKNFSKLVIGVMVAVVLTIGIQQYFIPNLKTLWSMIFAELILIILFRKSKNLHSDYWYNIVVDGMLLIPGIIILF
jgi:hypothetical protein